MRDERFGKEPLVEGEARGSNLSDEWHGKVEGRIRGKDCHPRASP